MPYVVKFDRAPGALSVPEGRGDGAPGVPLEDRQVEGNRPIAGRWVERWTLDRCGASVGYVIRFTTTRKGTTFVAEPQR